MSIKTTLYRIYDYLMTWLPGHRDDPNSFETRMRKIGDKYTSKIGKLVDEQLAHECEMRDEAFTRAQTAEAQAQALDQAAARAKADADKFRAIGTGGAIAQVQ